MIRWAAYIHAGEQEMLMREGGKEGLGKDKGNREQSSIEQKDIRILLPRSCGSSRDRGGMTLFSTRR